MCVYSRDGVGVVFGVCLDMVSSFVSLAGISAPTAVALCDSINGNIAGCDWPPERGKSEILLQARGDTVWLGYNACVCMLGKELTQCLGGGVTGGGGTRGESGL